jgi:hypothetical protein
MSPSRGPIRVAQPVTLQAAVLHSGGVDSVGHPDLVFERHERHDVAGTRQVLRDIELVTKGREILTV